ncbi:MAG: glycoside hydrolase, partial [Candidatus Marinimicrobia bacterium]|nr:glycoside hydrolase [Candidatus Neomarinimicrobiota bacterium]
MYKKFIHSILIFTCSLFITGALLSKSSAADEKFWPETEQSHHPWTRWWWLGNAVESEVITELLGQYADAGIGGVEITPIYGVKGYESKFIEYLSPEWMSMFRHTLESAADLGMGVDLTHGTGWPFGGPHISPADA